MQEMEAFMRYALAVFRSRNETLYLANLLISKGYRVTVINTPRDAGLACGISVRFDEKNLELIKNFIASKPFRSFSGFYRVSISNGKNVYENIG